MFDHLYLLGFGLVVVAIGSAIRWFFTEPKTSLIAIAGRAALAALLFPILLVLWATLAAIAGDESFTEGVIRGGIEWTAVIAGGAVVGAALWWGAKARTLPRDEVSRRLMLGGLVTAGFLGLVAAGAGALLAAVGHAPVNLSPPVITGIPRVGETLRVSPGRWTPRTQDELEFDYYWYRCRGGDCFQVGFNRGKYRLVKRDVGARISVSVLAYGNMNTWADSEETPVIR